MYACAMMRRHASDADAEDVSSVAVPAESPSSTVEPLH